MSAKPPRASAWLSQGLELLHERLGDGPRTGIDFEVVIVGSGYGGAMAASTLAGYHTPDGRPAAVCVLERGSEYLPGAFPSGMAELAGHVRFSTEGTARPRGRREGLFDVKVGSDVSALVANGLGGGSLINAGVMVEPPAAVSARLQAVAGELDDHYARARALLGAKDNTILDHHSGTRPRKYAALERLAPRMPPRAAFGAAPITVAMRAHRNDAGVDLAACTLCGDCATGCNHNAKASLDTNLLAEAKRRGAELYTGATVTRIERDDKGERWRLHVAYTNAGLRRRMPQGFVVHARRLIVAAGTYGSTELLLRSRSASLKFSPKLGQGFSSNGDMIAVAYDQADEANAVADECTEPDKRQVGPTITGMVRIDDARGDMLVEELAVPGPLRRLFEEVVATSATLHALGQPDRSVHAEHDEGHDPCAVDARALRHSTLLAVMGDDGAGGSMRLVGRPRKAEGGVKVVWPALRHHPLFARQLDVLAGAVGKDTARYGKILPYPLWKPLPDNMAYLLNGRRGPLLTVHPLGGCAMASSAHDGVVNRHGQVFRATPDRPDEVYDSLVVLDGSIVPMALAANPALTIAALALRAAEHLRAAWQLTERRDADQLAPRPIFRTPPAAATPRATMVQFTERLAGEVLLRDGANRPRACRVELTLHFVPRTLAPLILPGEDKPDSVAQRRRLEAGPGSSLVVYDLEKWRIWRVRREGSTGEDPAPLLQAPVAGSLEFFHRENSGRWQRTLRALGPWLRNRGMRDTWQWWFDREAPPPQAAEPAPAGLLDKLLARGRNALALASRAGEVRRFDYALTIGRAEATDGFDAAAFEGRPILGAKRFTYAFASNPWTQLTRMTLTQFPQLAAARVPPALELDTGFLVRSNLPLMRLCAQQDQPTALADVAGLAGYLLRLLLGVHMWSFRKPDTPPPRTPDLLPPELPGLQREQVWLDFPALSDGRQVRALLTRYRAADWDPALPPVLMIPGYSSSGTAFAHGAVQPNLAGYMAARRRDVWILDMRTSSAMATATHAWNFEHTAQNDIPAAVARVCTLSGHEKIDIVAHCMGAAMLSMAILGDIPQAAPYREELRALPDRIGKLVLSQVGPLVVFSQANIFRAYLTGYVRHLLPKVRFPFRVTGTPGMMDELIDRVLATLPYPDREFRLENPPWPWQRANFVRTRHRMDALYGRDFELPNLDAAVLDRIDDFFGPYSLVTLNQAIHLARLKTVTNRAGRNVYVKRARLRQRWKFPTHSIHGACNGLSDVATLGRIDAILREDAQCTYTTEAFDDLGHQDSLIGRTGSRVFAAIARFLDSPAGPAHPPGNAKLPGIGVGANAQPPAQFTARLPATGPIRLPSVIGSARMPVGAAASPTLHEADFVALVPVVAQGQRYAMFNPDGLVDPLQIMVAHVKLYASSEVEDVDGWVQVAADEVPAGADGVLMLMLFEESGGLEPPTVGWRTRWDVELMAKLAWYLKQQKSLLSDYERLDWIEALTPPVHEALAALLAQTPATELKAALITPDRPAVAPPSAKQAASSNDADGGAGAPVCFAVGSCQYPAGLLDQVPAFASYRRLAQLLDSTDTTVKPDFLVLLGDQIYADATAGLFDPSALDDRHVRPYEKLLGNEDVRKVLRLRVACMLDDHEIEDNWEPVTGQQGDANLAAGVAAYRKFQRGADLISHRGAARLHSREPLGFACEHRGLHFYLADTRTERDARTVANIRTARIMSDDSFAAMTTWLSDRHRLAPAMPKFLATPSIVAPGRIDAPSDLSVAGAACLRYDGWAGYPLSLRRLLAFIADHGIHGLVLLSGDEHISSEATLTIEGEGLPAVDVYAVHSSALYAPYPFANSREADMAERFYSFGFDYPDGGRRYRCTVRADYKPGDGFALLTVRDEGGRWTVKADFDR
ncbi:alkaline phosphatase D family protein [Massilia sp. YMA4]|uniref:alkaline phosphatase D family protein n=1 Tax=Massilia sp. YMA4 TaxID=1593482 RepID=UPI001878CF2C|nr:alkaline phosphatase D family protein [Massilia sp. YMA4]